MKRRTFLGLLSALPFIAKAKEVKTVSIEAGTANIDDMANTASNFSHEDMDLLLYGHSFKIDGKRVPPESIRLIKQG